MNTKPTFAKHLMSIPNVGDDADFERVQENEVLEWMIDQVNESTSCAESVVDQALAEVNASNLRGNDRGQCDSSQAPEKPEPVEAMKVGGQTLKEMIEDGRM